jgi:5-methylcytosine-specific restriction endonuclease McrA
MGLSKTQRNFVLQAYGYSNYKEYLQSELWASIREKILKKNDLCVCGCNRIANQVHHKVYSESNLLGKCLRGLVAINHDCHHDIEFDEGRKVNLGEANQRLKERKQQ